MEVLIKSLKGESVGKMQIEKSVFGIETIRGDLLQRTVRWQLARRRAGTHKTQERGDVSVSTRKSLRQKGSGGARHGSKNANIFVGGAVAHGPRVRNHGHGLPKKIRRAALAHALSSKVRDGDFLVLDGVAADSPKTGALSAQLRNLGLKRALIVDEADFDHNFVKGVRNISGVDILPVAGLNVYDVLRCQTLVVTKRALKAIEARFLVGPVLRSGAEGSVKADKAKTVPVSRSKPAPVSSGAASPEAFVDDVARIEGVGPKAAGALADAGFGTLRAFATADPAVLENVLNDLGLAKRAERDGWLDQARAMVKASTDNDGGKDNG